MYYTTYRDLEIVVLTVVWLLTAAVGFSLFGLAGGIAILVVLGLVFLGLLLLGLHLTNARLEQYGGWIPYPGGLGMWGVDLVDDRDPDALTNYQRANRELLQPDFDSNELDPSEAPRCPFCHAPLARANSKFCDACGSPLSGTAAPSTPPSAAQ